MQVSRSYNKFELIQKKSKERFRCGVNKKNCLGLRRRTQILDKQNVVVLEMNPQLASINNKPTHFGEDKADDILEKIYVVSRRFSMSSSKNQPSSCDCASHCFFANHSALKCVCVLMRSTRKRVFFALCEDFESHERREEEVLCCISLAMTNANILTSTNSFCRLIFKVDGIHEKSAQSVTPATYQAAYCVGLCSFKSNANFVSFIAEDLCKVT